MATTETRYASLTQDTNQDAPATPATKDTDQAHARYHRALDGGLVEVIYYADDPDNDEFEWAQGFDAEELGA